MYRVRQYRSLYNRHASQIWRIRSGAGDFSNAWNGLLKADRVKSGKFKPGDEY
jgi:hypothetical protein